jgi:hypothetical protein
MRNKSLGKFCRFKEKKGVWISLEGGVALYATFEHMLAVEKHYGPS